MSYNWTKYNNKKVTVNGQVFDSKKEANRYKELLLLEKAGVIKNLSRQVKFVLIPSQRDENGKRHIIYAQTGTVLIDENEAEQEATK